MTDWAHIFFTNSKKSLFKNLVAAPIPVTVQCHFLYSETVIFSSDMLEYNSENYANVQNYCIKTGIKMGRMALRRLAKQKIENWCIILCCLLRNTSLAYRCQCLVVSFKPGVLHPPGPLIQTALLYSSLCHRNFPQDQCVANFNAHQCPMNPNLYKGVTAKLIYLFFHFTFLPTELWLKIVAKI